ncbi:hypothetical protein D6C94_03460 [Aureobasidium pullulans]|uniref:Pre-rRNA-processing protein PNO1 n=1 Tax=Aureobasidium pullulans TaxID=5580 RepID=A0AB38M3E8_AURPU|nr:hypothetical protein D6C94_03460 [Aureobasidium pullulans]
MPAPTALQRADPEEIAQNLHDTPVVANNEDDEMLISTTDAPAVQAADQTEQDTAMTVDSQPLFAAEKTANQQHRSESRKVPVPPHRWTPLKSSWPKIYPPLVEHLKLQVRVNDRLESVQIEADTTLHQHTLFMERVYGIQNFEADDSWSSRLPEIRKTSFRA